MDSLNLVSKTLKALSDLSRLRIISLLNFRKDVCVCELQEVIGLSQSTISSHLKILENSGLVSFVKNGLWVNYRISETLSNEIRNIINDILKCLSDSNILKEDIEKLQNSDRGKICSRK